MESARFAKLLELAEDIARFDSRPRSEDLEEYAALAQMMTNLGKRFVSAARAITNREIQDLIHGINMEIGTFGAQDLHADLLCLVDRVRELAEHPESCQWAGVGDAFVEPSLLDDLRHVKCATYDLSKLIRFCEEMNSCVAAGNLLATTLLIRAILNHVPPIFGQSTFQQVVSHASRSVKELLKPLEDVARDVADMHTHALIRHRESLPTKSQIVPFKASLEVLLQEIIVRLGEPR